MDALPAPQDIELLKKLAAFPEVAEAAAREREPHRITTYLHELATIVHGWYHHTRAVGAPEGRCHRAGPAPAGPGRANRPGQRARPARHFRP